MSEQPQNAAISRYREFPGGSFTRWNPGWSLRVGPLWLHWHVLNVWKWGKTPRFARIDRRGVNVGKRLLTWSVR